MVTLIPMLYQLSWWKSDSISGMALRRYVVYRSAFIVLIISITIQLLAIYSIWRPLTEAAGKESWAWAQTYLLIAFVVNSLLSFQTEARLHAAIRTGDISTELVLPIGFVNHQLCQAVGAAMVDLVLASAIASIFAAFSGHRPLIPNLKSWAFLTLAIPLTFVLRFLFAFLVAQVAQATQSARGLIMLRSTLTSVLSGALIPFWILPPWIAFGLELTPFASMTYLPVKTALSSASAMEMGRVIGVQSFWCLLLWITALWLEGRMERSRVIQGG